MIKLNLKSKLITKKNKNRKLWFLKTTTTKLNYNKCKLVIKLLRSPFVNKNSFETYYTPKQ